MWNAKETMLKACRSCLSTAGKLERLTGLMRKVFYNICGLMVEPNDNHPQYVCSECSAQLRKALAIRRKTRRAHFVLQQIFMTKKVKIGNDVPVPSEMTNKQQSEAVPLEYGDAVIQSPNADIKRKHITQDTEKSAKRVKYKETFVGTKTKPQTGKSLGIIDGFGDIVEGYTQNDALIENETHIDQNKARIGENKKHIAENTTHIAENKTYIAENKTHIGENKTHIGENKTHIGENKTRIGENKTRIGEKNGTVETLLSFIETSVFNDPSGLVHQSKTSEYDTRLVVASGPKPNTNIKSGPSGSNNIATRPNYSSEVTDNVEETRLEIDAQDLAANYEIVEVDGVHYVNIDDVLYKVEYS